MWSRLSNKQRTRQCTVKNIFLWNFLGIFFLLTNKVDQQSNLYRFPPTLGAAFMLTFCAFAAALGLAALAAPAAGAFFVVAFVVFFTSLAALK